MKLPGCLGSRVSFHTLLAICIFYRTRIRYKKGGLNKYIIALVIPYIFAKRNLCYQFVMTLHFAFITVLVIYY